MWLANDEVHHLCMCHMVRWNPHGLYTGGLYKIWAGSVARWKVMWLAEEQWGPKGVLMTY